jgi:hypothetical protein
VGISTSEVAVFRQLRPNSGHDVAIPKKEEEKRKRETSAAGIHTGLRSFFGKRYLVHRCCRAFYASSCVQKCKAFYPTSCLGRADEVGGQKRVLGGEGKQGFRETC